MTEDKYQEQCSTVVRLVQSSQYKYRAEQCVSVLVMRCNMLLQLFLKSTYIRQEKKNKSKQAAASAHQQQQSYELQNLQYSEEKRQEVYTAAAAAASLTHTHQAVHVHSSWPGFNKSICTVMI